VRVVEGRAQPRPGAPAGAHDRLRCAEHAQQPKQDDERAGHGAAQHERPQHRARLGEEGAVGQHAAARRSARRPVSGASVPARVLGCGLCTRITS